MERKTNLFPEVEPDAAKPMRYRISANVSTLKMEEAVDVVEMYFDNEDAATTMYRILYRNKDIYPIILHDNGKVMWKSEGGSTTCYPTPREED